MNLQKAKRIKLEQEEMNRLLEQDEQRQEQALRTSEIDEIELLIEQQEFERAKTIVGQSKFLDKQEKLSWDNKIRNAKHQNIKDSLPERIPEMHVSCRQCSKELQPDFTESYQDYRKLCLVAFCDTCQVRSAVQMPGSLRNNSVIESVLRSIA